VAANLAQLQASGSGTAANLAQLPASGSGTALHGPAQDPLSQLTMR